jgi:hypothetical protein
MNYFFLFFLPFLINTNTNYEFYGVLKLNGKQESAISYKIVFTEKNGKVSGYSITDITGEHETKNIIEGTYNEKTKTLVISEKNIVYTKSTISDNLFCFVNFTSKIKLESNKAKLNGDFTGIFKNKTKCINGTFELIGSRSVNKLLQKVNKKIQKSKELKPDDKIKYNPIKIFDSLQTQQMSARQNLNIFHNGTKITFVIWDNGVEDGDLINFYHNDKLVLKNFKVTLEKKTVEVVLSNNINEFTIEALNQGLQGLNTAMITVDGDQSVAFQTNLLEKETTKVTILKNQ